MTGESENTPVLVDVVSDVICPWCYLGKRRLDRALERLDGRVPVSIAYRPFLLDPSIPEGGVSRSEYIASKFPDPDVARRSSTALKEYGLAEGIAFAFDKIIRTPNTLDAHRLIRWSRSQGVQDAVVERLFHVYFQKGQDIGERDVLLSVAGECGMDVVLVMELLAGEDDKKKVFDEVKHFYKLGVSGVPTFILNRQYGMVGAQDVDVLIDVIERLGRGEDLRQPRDEDA
ncbi:MAG: DsbA family oxidoreductase [Alphaproteobacteria bacterium]